MQPLKAETEKSTEPPRSDVRTPQAAAGSKGFVVGLVGAALAQHLERAVLYPDGDATPVRIGF
ncbi:hypothetical protein [Oryza sativa Japonica Group]|uniref:Uncharacterized protein n=1 Tax=Oryza sativa subsp. japonica TaxID=39947 RepID=Q5JLE2_ORYSJ|nr:hypothetical protein [Oryza sativa Japonica Group]BAD87715.1 hypothetical protein [Oryza sativa Japonica Group]